MFHYRKIPARSDDFIKLWDKFKLTLIKYENFLEMETQNNPLAQSKTSGKSSSYSRYLRRLYIIITEVDQFQHLSINDLEFVNILKQLLDTEEFKNYNNDEGHFPSATINSYVRFFNQNLLYEDNILETVHDIDTLFLDNESDQRNILSEDELKPKEIIPEQVIETAIQSRSVKEKNRALQRSNWKCEYNNAHSTFLNKYNNKQYLEAHHLIPLGHQPNYKFSLDTFSNIIILCPTCHRFIHYGRNEEVKDMLQYLYEDRKKELETSGIKISFDELLEIYGS